MNRHREDGETTTKDRSWLGLWDACPERGRVKTHRYLEGRRRTSPKGGNREWQWRGTEAAMALWEFDCLAMRLAWR